MRPMYNLDKLVGAVVRQAVADKVRPPLPVPPAPRRSSNGHYRARDASRAVERARLDATEWLNGLCEGKPLLAAKLAKLEEEFTDDYLWGVDPEVHLPEPEETPDELLD